MFKSDYLGAWDLPGDTVVTIEKVVPSEEIIGADGKKESKPILYFKNAKKKMVLNKTNAKSISKALGHDTDGWEGRKITLYPDTCKAFGEVVECVRVRDKEAK
jgi:hypothetical protein